jgi:signal transduction histidine kinase
MRLGRARSLAIKMAALVLALLSVVALALGLTTFFITREWLRTTAIANLEALASARQVAMDAQLGGYLGRIRALSGSHLTHRLQRLVQTSGDARQSSLQELQARLRRELVSTESLTWIGVFDHHGRRLVSTGQRHGKPATLARPESLTAAKVRPVVFEPRFDQGRLELELAAPIRDREGGTIAVVVLEFDARDLLKVTGDYTGLGRTGETVLGVRKRDKVHFLAPLRFDPGLRKVQPAAIGGERAAPLLHATAGQSGVTTAMDYRDVRVIAAFRPIASTGWGLVVKQDEAEAFGSIDRMRTLLLIVLGGVLLVGAAITVPLTFALIKPLRELQAATGRVAAGDLTVKVPVGPPDEVGQLAESFNAMVRELMAAREKLERSNHELDAFAYVVSHDLKAPLRGIINLTNWLEEDLEDQLAADQRKQMELIRQRVGRMQALIDGLLEYSRVGRVRKSPTAVDTGRLVRTVVESMDLPDNVEVRVQTTAEIFTDELRLTQVFQNLIDNAVKHHPGPEIRITVDSCEVGDSWDFTVQDNGAGVAPLHHERIFGIFQSLGNGDEVQGTGVGLALVKKIVESNGGTVRVESSGVAGEGARFCFTWPRRSQG